MLLFRERESMIGGEYVHNHLLPGKKRVGDELASPQDDVFGHIDELGILLK